MKRRRRVSITTGTLLVDDDRPYCSTPVKETDEQRAPWRSIVRLERPADEVAAELEEHRDRFHGGEHDHLFFALFLCGEHDLPIPAWVYFGFRDAWERFVAGDVDALGEAFGLSRPRGFRIEAYRKRARLRYEAYARVRARHENERVPVDECLFAEIAAELDIGKTQVAALYYSVKRR